jgi:hypothetical protein
MSIYKGDTKIADSAAGMSLSIDAELSPNSTNPVQNKAISEAMGYSWVKPADWIDIRSGALPNSMYFLVAHSSDYTTYPQFVINATISSSGTYDVYVDGIKQATTASGSATTLTWQTLALTSGYDVTYPANLRTHVVRVTPSSSSNTITQIKNNAGTSVEQGTLWVHSTCTNSILVVQLLYHPTYKNLLCEAFTTNQETFKTGWGEQAFDHTSLKTAPIIETTNANSISGMFANTKLKKVVFKNLSKNNATGLGTSEYVEEWHAIGGAVKASSGSFYLLPNLKIIDGSFSFDGVTDCNNLFYGTPNVQNPIFLDTSEATGMTRLVLGGTSSKTLRYIKGVTVSSSAPFSNGNSPQIDVSYTGLDRAALVNLFNSLPTVSNSQVCNVTGATGAADLDATDLAIATARGWTITR